jgi:Leucine-rich repeat (LRR) protein
LAEVPPFLWEMNSLENVRLWYCNLTAVPSSVKNLIHLKEVCFKGNQLNSLPDDLFALPELTYLNVGENKFAYLPESLNKLSKLDYLGIFSNPIKELKLDDNMLKHVRFIAAWNTELAPDFKNSIEKNSTITKVNQSGNGLH